MEAQKGFGACSYVVHHWEPGSLNQILQLHCLLAPVMLKWTCEDPQETIPFFQQKEREKESSPN